MRAFVSEFLGTLLLGDIVEQNLVGLLWFWKRNAQHNRSIFSIIV